jgi:hypothetical protein
MTLSLSTKSEAKVVTLADLRPYIKHNWPCLLSFSTSQRFLDSLYTYKSNIKHLPEEENFAQ